MGLKKLKEILEKYINRPILVYFDPDVDGLFAGYFVCKYLEKLGLKYAYYVNSKRAHGFKLDVEKVKGYLVIAVDFAITDEEMQHLVDNDVAVISIDHHDTSEQLIYKVSATAEGVVINNQYPFEPADNRYQSGAGMVFETLRLLDSSFDTPENRAIVGITLLSDARPIENAKAREYLKATYSENSTTKYLQYLVTSTVDIDYSFGVPRLDRNFIDYTFSPRINSMLRFGKEFEAIDFILGKGMLVPSLKDKQKAVIQEMKSRMHVLELSAMKVVVVRSEECNLPSTIDITNFIGLLCSDVKGVGKSVFAFTMTGDKVTRASFRGQYSDVAYKDGFQSIGINAQGHQPAFGVVDFKFDETIWTRMNAIVSELDTGHNSTLKIIPAKNLSFVLDRQDKKAGNSIADLSNLPIMNSRGYRIANENCYVRDMYRTYIKYEGWNVTSTRKTDKFAEYLVDGKNVKSFNPDLKVTDGIILPILEKGYIQLYLHEA